MNTQQQGVDKRRGIAPESGVSRTSVRLCWENVEHYSKQVKDLGRGCSSARTALLKALASFFKAEDPFASLGFLPVYNIS